MIIQDNYKGLKLISKIKNHFSKKNVLRIIISAVIAVLVYFISSLYLNQQQSILVSIVLFMVVLWTNEGLSLGTVSLLPLLLFPLLGVSSFKETLPNYFQPIMLLFVGGILIALSIEKSSLHKFISKKIISIFPKTPRGVIYSLAVTSAMMSAVLSNTTVALMLLPVALSLSKDGKMRIRLLLALAYGASIGGILTPIGTPPNIIYLGFLDKLGMAAPSFFGWIILVAPLSILMLLIVPYIISFGVHRNKFEKIRTGKLNLHQKKLLFILAALILLLLINSPIEPFYSGLGLNENYILFVFGLAMFLPGFSYLKFSDLKKFPIGIILLFGAGFAIAFAFLSIGLVDALSSSLVGLTSLPLIVMIGIIVLFVIFLTELTSNTALTSVMIPTMYGFAQTTGMNVEFMLLIPTVAASMAFMLPIATPPNAIILSSKAIRIRDMIKIGFLINLIALVLITLVAFFYWQFMLA
ncbi:MAG: SLC13/DASS family transporter [Nanoarchaeota archaeon]|nr:SLC13/DASS family transporter [Nanoarchaeota archaeon]